MYANMLQTLLLNTKIFINVITTYWINDIYVLKKWLEKNDKPCGQGDFFYFNHNFIYIVKSHLLRKE